MIKQLENGKVLVAHITVDNKEAKKEYVKDIVDVCLSQLYSYINGEVLSYKEVDIKYEVKPVTIEEYIIREQYAFSKHKAINIDFKTVGSSIDIYISANQSTYGKSIFANEELLERRYGIKKVNFDIRVNKLENKIKKKQLPFMFINSETRNLIVNKFYRVSNNN
ncbi:hypothetical protein P4679_25070 [Priestia megaterium]|uniref:hypothetical protein n=1 Tax=Priestia megaterium TaxID=1404 RepID=UPI002E1F8B86|nr:hypothetical protein [Priestia megaterium]